MRGNIRWVYDSLTPTLAGFHLVMDEALEAYVEAWAEATEDYAQANAPWADDTGAARAGLAADYQSDGNRHAIILYHTVDYGIWLEIKDSGLYAIILPTIEYIGPQIMAGMGNLMEVL